MAGLSEFKFSLRAESQRPVSSQLLDFGTPSGVIGSAFSGVIGSWVGVTSLFIEASHTTPWPTPRFYHFPGCVMQKLLVECWQKIAAHLLSIALTA